MLTNSKNKIKNTMFENILKHGRKIDISLQTGTTSCPLSSMITYFVPFIKYIWDLKDSGNEQKYISSETITQNYDGDDEKYLKLTS
jgi:hypothetical protein